MEQIYSLFVFLFWFGLFIVFYTYIGYGILLYLLVRIKETIKKEDIRALPVPLPDVTLFIAAYNEEDIIPKKMANCRSLSYPADKLHIVWVTDGSNDRTNERLAAY